VSGEEALATLTEIKIPDIGGASDVDVIEVLVAPGDTVAVDDSLITLESDKASMEIPASHAGVVKGLKIKVGDKVSEGAVILTLEVAESEEAATPAEKVDTKAETPAPAKTKTEPAPTAKPAATAVLSPAPQSAAPSGAVYAGPSVRRLASELGVELNKVKGTGTKDRIQKSDIIAFVKAAMLGSAGGGLGLNVAAAPVIDFTKFGEVELQPLTKIKRLTGQYLHRNWVTVPHVTQFDEADITDLEAFRKAQKKDAEAQGIRLTLLAFIMKEVVSALQKFPQFNSSLDPSGEQLILKKYFNIGVAVDTPNGLVVPVIRDVDHKGALELAKELGDISAKAREKGLTTKEMEGGTFTISSLGGISGTAFTPIVNSPDVAILGLSRSSIKPVYQDSEFVPRLMLPISLSYDHRVIDGAEGARFTRYLADCLADARHLIL